VNVEMILHEIPPLLIYITVGLVIGVESLGVPLPGEIMLVSASLLASRQELDISPVWIGISASTGAIIGDTIGYFIGRRLGKPLFERLGRRFPKHFSPGHVALAERIFLRWGVYAVFFGRFIALLRVTSAWLAGLSRMEWWRFFLWNASGGIVWAVGISLLAYWAGKAVAEAISRYGVYAVVGLVVVAALGFVALKLWQRRTVES
jgi:membrane protein DedA with SNARE-associated domain